MAIVFKTPKSALNTTSKAIQNLGNGECPPCPECPEVNLETADVNYTENGEYTLTPEGDGFSKVDITVNIDTETPYNEGYAAGETAGAAAQKALLTSTTITQNGTTTREDGWNSVTVNVQPVLQAKTATPTTSQQVITPDQGKDGLSSVTVSGVTNAIDANIQAGNIKNGVSILGVTGSYDPQPSLESQTASYTANGTYTITPSTGYDGMSDVEVTVNVSGSNCPDWSSIGWDCNDVTATGIDADVAVTAALLENYVPAIQSEPFANTAIVYAPKVSPANNSNPGSSYVGWFANCTNLTYVPNIRFESGQTASQTSVGCENMFNGCTSLTKVSLDLTDYGNGSQSNGYVGGANDMFNGCTALTDVTLTNTNGFRDCRRMFYNCRALVNAPMFNTSNVTDMSEMFENCNSLVSVPLYDTSNVTNMSAMFYATTTSWAPDFTTIPLFNTSNVTNMREMFKNNVALRTIPAIDTSNVTDVANMFSQCSSLQELPQLDFGKVTILSTSPYDGFLYAASNIATLWGFVNLGKSFTGTDANGHRLQLSGSQLTKQSIMNVINNLAAPDDANCNDATLKLSAASYALLTEEDIAIATAKRWSVSA